MFEIRQYGLKTYVTEDPDSTGLDMLTLKCRLNDVIPGSSHEWIRHLFNLSTNEQRTFFSHFVLMHTYILV